MTSRAARSLCIALATALLILTPTAALAEEAKTPSPSDTDVTPEEVRSAYTAVELLLTPEIADAEAGAGPEQGVTMRAASFTVICKPTADNPHYSSGAQGVIYKTRVVCTGTGSYPATVVIRVRGGLFWDSARYNGDTSNGVSWSQLRTSDETRTVSVNGSTNTFYTPRTGQTGAYFTGHYQGTSTVTIVTPTGQTIGASTSNAVFINP